MIFFVLPLFMASVWIRSFQIKNHVKRRDRLSQMKIYRLFPNFLHFCTFPLASRLILLASVFNRLTNG